MKTTKREPGRSLFPNVEIKDSPGKGRGIFATKDLADREMIHMDPVIELRVFDANLIEYTILRNYVFGGESEEFPARLVLGPISLVNHGKTKKERNAEVDCQNAVAILYAIKPIKAGEEILIDYGWNPNKR